MARAKLHPITRNDLDAYRMPSFKRNPGVVAIMGITNGRGAYAKRKAKKVGGAGCHGIAPAKYRRQGSTERSQYAFPECWGYPVRTKRKSGETTPHWHKRDQKAVKRALSRFGRYGSRYTPELRKEIGSNIARAAKAVGLGSPKAMEYRRKYGLEGAKVIQFPGRKRPAKAAPMRMAANRSGSMLYYRSASRRKPGYRRNSAPPPARRSTAYGPPPGGWQASSTLPQWDIPRHGRGGTKARVVIGYDPETGRPVYADQLPKGARKSRSTSKKGRKAPMAKKAKARKAPKKRRTAKQIAASKRNLAKGRKARKAKTSKRKTAKKTTKRRVAKKTTKRTTKKRRTAKQIAASKRNLAKGRKARKGGKRKAAKKTTKKTGRKTKRRSTLARQLAAARALNTRLKGGKKRKSSKRRSSGSRKSTEAMFASNRRRRSHRGYRRNGASGLLSSIKPYLVLGGLALGGFAAHRLISKPVASLTSSFLSPTWGSVVAGLAVAGLGIYGIDKVSFLKARGVGLKTGMLVSAGALVLKSLLPDFANTVGIGGLESVSTGPRYSMGGFKQAMAGDPILQAAAGEYYSQGTGEYMSSDLYKAGPMGEYQMRQLDVLGDTGSYELQSMYGTGATPTYDGVRPESADTFLEAMAGVQDRSTYIPHEGESAITGGESSFDAGIFDAGNVLSG